MSLNYTSYVAAIQNLAAIPAADAEFTAIIPNMIDDAEQRIYRDLDFLQTTTRDSSQALTASNRNFSYPTTASGIFVVTEQINVILPAGTTNPDMGERVALLPASKQFLDIAYPSAAGAGVPSFFAMLTQTSILVGPWPDSNYQVEVVGTTRPLPLSVTNPNTFLATNLPDLFIAASMVFIAGYQKNFSEMGDQPQQAISWESHYQSLLKSAVIEEARKKFTAEGWSSDNPSPIATPPRT